MVYGLWPESQVSPAPSFSRWRRGDRQESKTANPPPGCCPSASRRDAPADALECFLARRASLITASLIKEQSMRFPALAVLALGLATLAAVHSPAQTAPQVPAPTTAPWDYVGSRGALEWGKLDPAYKVCKDGHEQSPIDIRGARLNKALQPI